MPQAAWEALLRDAVQGLRPPYTPQALRQWLQATHPKAWAIGTPSPPCHHHTRKGKNTGKGRARDRQGHSSKRARRGPKWGQAPIGTGRRKGSNVGAGNHPTTRKGQERGPRHGGQGLHGKRHDPHPGRAYHDGGTSAVSPPPNAARLPGAHPPTRTAEASIGRCTDHISAHPPATGNHTGDGGHTYTGRTGHIHRGGRRERRRTAHHHALDARRRPRPPRGPPHRHRKRTKARP